MTHSFRFSKILPNHLKLALIVFSALSLPLSSPVAASSEKEMPPVILVSGDSLSAAYRMKTTDGWVAQLQKRLQVEGFPHQIINTSISGETSSGGLTRFAHELSKYQPRIVLIELGANDGLRGLPLQNLRDNLTQMIQAAKQQKARVLLLGMKLPPNYGLHYAQAFSQLFVELAQQHNTALLPFLLEGVAAQRELMQNDGLHPTAAAQDRILENVWPKLKPLLVE